MATIKDYSYGVVPVRKEEGEWQVFVLHQIARADTYWTFPKGHPEAGETPEQAALRELQEETALVPKELDTTKRFEHTYYFTHENDTIEKYVGYFLGYIDDPSYTIQEEEVAAACWCSFKEARELLTYDLSKTLLDEVAVYLEHES